MSNEGLEKAVEDFGKVETPEVTTPDTKPADTSQFTQEEKEALELGWKPKDQFEGPENEWSPAHAFLKYGALKKQYVEKDKEVKKLNKVTQLMKQHHTEVRKIAFQDALETLRKERDNALTEENFVKAEKIKDQIDEVKSKLNTEAPLPPQVVQELQEANQTPDPAYYEFLDRNPWYKPGGKDEMSKRADAIGMAVYAENPTMNFAEVTAEVEKVIKKMYPEKFEKVKSPVNDNGRTGAGSTGKDQVKLSQKELQVAKMFGMSAEEYAAQAKSYQGR